MYIYIYILHALIIIKFDISNSVIKPTISISISIVNVVRIANRVTRIEPRSCEVYTHAYKHTRIKSPAGP